MGPLPQRAIILVGFGSPDPADPCPFLAKLFSDPISSPFAAWGPFRRPAARVFARVMAGPARRRYQRIAHRTATLQMVADLARRLEAFIDSPADERVRVAIASIYGEPSIESVVESLAGGGAADVLVIPLFPHGCLAITEPVRAVVERAREMLPPGIAVTIAGPWHRSRGFIRAWAGAIRRELERFPSAVRNDVHLLFTSHAIPLRHVRKGGDAYPENVAESASAIRAEVGEALAMSVAFQSAPRFGRWTGPNMEEELSRLRREGVRRCLIAPIGFLYDNVETWCDLDERILARAAAFGMEEIRRAKPPTNSPHLLEACAALAFAI